MTSQAYWDKVEALTMQVRHLLSMPIATVKHLWATRGDDETVLGFNVEAIQAALTLRMAGF